MPSTSNPRSSAGHQVLPDDAPAIVMHDVRKTFRINHTNSFKETFVAMLQRKELSSRFNAVDGIDLEVPSGQSIAILGRNGSGKSTTLKMISGVLRPDTGWIRTRGRVAGLLEVGAGFNPNLTGRDNVYLNAAILGMSKEETDARFDEILEFSEIGEFIDTEVKHYSSGMYARLGFSVAVHTEVDVLLVDEVLSVGDVAFRAKCTERMLQIRERGKTLFIVSHSINQVRELCERGVVMQRGKIVFDGPIEEAIEFTLPGNATMNNGPVGFRVADELRKVYERSRSVFGRPTAQAVQVTENGGGVSQLFENGIITYSANASRAFGLPQGSFLESYLAAGGPAGSWGFLAGAPQGSVSEGTRHLLLQNGIAAYSPARGVVFSSETS